MFQRLRVIPLLQQCPPLVRVRDRILRVLRQRDVDGGAGLLAPTQFDQCHGAKVGAARLYWNTACSTSPMPASKRA
jgi:hypothetical protein